MERYGRTPLRFDSLGKWVENTPGSRLLAEQLSAGSSTLSGSQEVSSFSACVLRTLNPVLDHSFCLYLLTSQLDFILLMPQALMQDSTGAAQPVLCS